MIAFGRSETKRLLAVFAIVLLVVTAGCAGLSPDDTGESTPDTEGPDNDDTNQTDSDTDDSEDGTDNESTAGGSETNLGTFGDLDPAETDKTAEQLLAESADQLAAVDSYRLDQQVVNVQRQNNQSQTVRLNQTARVDRTQRRIAAQGTTTTELGSTTVQRYLLNGSLYESSERIAQQLGSEWVQTNVSSQFDQIFRQFDSAQQAEPLFRNASATIEGQTTIDGQRVYAVNATVDLTTVANIRPNIVGADEFQLNVWVSAESSLPLQLAEDSILRLSTTRAEFTQETDSVLRFRFENVDISLPSEAEGAPRTSELTAQ